MAAPTRSINDDNDNDNENLNADKEGGRELEVGGNDASARVAESSQAGEDEDGYLTEGSRNDEFLLEEPADDAINSLPFANFFCRRMEKLWNNIHEKNPNRNKWTGKQRLEYILQRQMIDDLNGQTVFPYVRLLLPDQDSRRLFRVKEPKIAEMYCRHLGFGKESKNRRMLYNYTDPSIVPAGVQVGGLPCVSTKANLTFCNIMFPIIYNTFPIIVTMCTNELPFLLLNLTTEGR